LRIIPHSIWILKKTDIHENSSAEDSENSESDSDSDLEDDDKDRNDDRKKDKTPKQEFLDWLKSVGIIVQNLTSDFQDGKNICKLVNVLEPDTIMPSQITDDALANATLAIDISSKKYGIPALVDASDLVESPQSLTNMTYLSYFRGKYLQIQEEKERKKQEEQKKKRKKKWYNRKGVKKPKEISPLPPVEAKHKEKETPRKHKHTPRDRKSGRVSAPTSPRENNSEIVSQTSDTEISDPSQKEKENKERESQIEKLQSELENMKKLREVAKLKVQIEKEKLQMEKEEKEIERKLRKARMKKEKADQLEKEKEIEKQKMEEEKNQKTI